MQVPFKLRYEKHQSVGTESRHHCIVVYDSVNQAINKTVVFSLVQSKLIQTVAANYVLWPFAHFVNFRFIPNEHRILYNNVVSVRPRRLRAHYLRSSACI